MLEFIKNTLNTLGYVGIVFLMFLPFTLSEIVMPLLGFMTIQGKFLFAGVVAAGTFGGVIGTLPFYYLGKLLGDEQLKVWTNTYGKWLMISVKDIEKAEEWFNRHGRKAVFLCRLVPGVRLTISIPAGVTSMNLATFLSYSTLGLGLWVVLLTFLGRLLGEHYDQVSRYVGFTKYIVLGIIVVTCIVWILKRRKQ